MRAARLRELGRTPARCDWMSVLRSRFHAGRGRRSRIGDVHASAINLLPGSDWCAGQQFRKPSAVVAGVEVPGQQGIVLGAFESLLDVLAMFILRSLKSDQRRGEFHLGVWGRAELIAFFTQPYPSTPAAGFGSSLPIHCLYASAR